MKPPGVIVNANARRARRDPGLVSRLRRLVPKEYVYQTRGLDEVDAALEALLELAVERVVLVGGDGSVGGTLTPLVRIFAARGPLPTVTLLPGGTVNTIATSLGGLGLPDRALEHMLSGAAPRLETTRALVRVEPDGDPARARLGLIFVAGAAARWLELYNSGRVRGSLAAAALVTRIIGSGLRGGALAARVFAARPVSLALDGATLENTSFTLLAAASVEDIGLGFKPFLSAGESSSRIHFLHTDATAGRLAAELPAFRLGLFGPASCLRHHSLGEVRLHFAGPELWSLDADLFGTAETLRVSAGPALNFAAY